MKLIFFNILESLNRLGWICFLECNDRVIAFQPVCPEHPAKRSLAHV